MDCAFGVVSEKLLSIPSSPRFFSCVIFLSFTDVQEFVINPGYITNTIIFHCQVYELQISSKCIVCLFTLLTVSSNEQTS